MCEWYKYMVTMVAQVTLVVADPKKNIANILQSWDSRVWLPLAVALGPRAGWPLLCLQWHREEEV